MRRNSVFKPTMIEALEDRMVLSHAHAHLHEMVAAQIQQISTRIYGASQYVLPSEPGADSVLNLKGQGSVHFQGIGTFHVTGSITENLSVDPSTQQSQGTLLLRNRQGTVTLQLSGPVFDFGQNRQRVPLQFFVSDATGAYAAYANSGATGTGSIIQHRVPSVGPNTVSVHGNFALRLQLDSQPVGVT